MRIIPWLLTLMLLLSPTALAQDEDGKDNETEDEKETGSNDRGSNESRDEEGEEAGSEEREDETDDADEREEDEAPRRVEIETNGLETSIKMSREDAAGEDEIEIKFDAGEAKLAVKYEREADDAESEQKLVARFHELIEFVDANGNGAYDPGEVIASAYLLGEEAEVAGDVHGRATWQPVTATDVTKGNASGKQLDSRATFANGSVFGLTFYVFGDFANVDGATLQPTEAKLDILIQNYPYVRNDTNVGLVLTLKAEEEFEREHEFVDPDEEGIAASGAVDQTSFSLVFTWKDVARVDGVDQRVHATVLKNETSAESERSEDAEERELEQKALLVLSYARGDDILHDPTVGVSYQTLSAGTSPIPAPSIVLVGALIATVAVLARARRQG